MTTPIFPCTTSIAPKGEKASLNSPRKAQGPMLKLQRIWRGTLVGYLFILPALLFLVVLIVYPILVTLQMSTSKLLPDLSSPWIGFSNYAKILADKAFWRSVLVSGEFTAITVVLHLIVGMAFALLLSCRWPSIRLRNLLRGLIILPWIFSTAASSLMWTLLLHPFGTLNYMARAWFGVSQPISWFATATSSMLTLAVVNLWHSFPFYMVIMLGGLQSIPDEFYEAAKVDGASSWQSFWRITLPMMRPVIVALTVIDIIGTMAMFDLVRMLTGGGPNRATETVAYYLYRMAFMDGRLNYAAAISIVILLGLLLFIGVYLRLFARGGIDESTSF
jgi:multiple sugar transport system permease protein